MTRFRVRHIDKPEGLRSAKGGVMALTTWTAVGSKLRYPAMRMVEVTARASGRILTEPTVRIVDGTAVLEIPSRVVHHAVSRGDLSWRGKAGLWKRIGLDATDPLLVDVEATVPILKVWRPDGGVDQSAAALSLEFGREVLKLTLADLREVLEIEPDRPRPELTKH